VSVVVSDSSPLNYLAALHDFDLLRQVYGTLLIPPLCIQKLSNRAATIPFRQRCDRRWHDGYGLPMRLTPKELRISEGSAAWTRARVKRSLLRKPSATSLF